MQIPNLSLVWMKREIWLSVMRCLHRTAPVSGLQTDMKPGHGQPSFDKQFARDWLKANPDNDWTLPQEIVDKTIQKYLQGYEMLTGKKLGE